MTTSTAFTSNFWTYIFRVLSIVLRIPSTSVNRDELLQSRQTKNLLSTLLLPSSNNLPTDNMKKNASTNAHVPMISPCWPKAKSEKSVRQIRLEKMLEAWWTNWMARVLSTCSGGGQTKGSPPSCSPPRWQHLRRVKMGKSKKSCQKPLLRKLEN